MCPFNAYLCPIHKPFINLVGNKAATLDMPILHALAGFVAFLSSSHQRSKHKVIR